MKLSSLSPSNGSVKVNRRNGRGHGSGGGGTARRGHKGAKSRSGYSQKLGFEGGQMPLQRRVPKFGFNNINRTEYKAINLDTIQALVEKTGAKSIDLGMMYNNGLISKTDLVKILGRGEVSQALDVKAHAFSASAKEAIEKAGGSATVDTTFDPAATANIVAVKVAKVEEPKAKKVAAPKAEPKVEVEVAPVVEEIAPAVEVVEEVAPVEEVEAKPKKATKKAAAGDDLKVIEGIGPKIADLLINAGIVTFADLAATSAERVKEILSEAGPRYAIHDPSTWAEQSELARDGKWDELKALQDKLNGGKVE
jgi:large subunit ribosomal protein L15